MITQFKKLFNRYIWRNRFEQAPRRGLSGAKQVAATPTPTVTEFRDQYGLIRLEVA